MTMTKKECIDWVKSHLEIRYARNNGAFKGRNRVRTVGPVNHSVGVAQPSVEAFYRKMNKSDAKWGVNAILGDFDRGDGRILLVMPYDRRPWGCGKGSKGTYNDTRIQWEVCEPAGHTYAGGTMIGYDVQKNALYFVRMWKMLVAWNVYIADKYGYDASRIVDHHESHLQGYASNHADISQWLPKHGKSMDALRQEVRNILMAKEPPKYNVPKQFPVMGKINGEPLNVRSGPGTSYKKVGKLHRGDVVEIVSYKDGWYKIGQGWVSAEYVVILSAQKPQPKPPVEEDEDMTLDTFKKLYSQMKKEWADNDCATYSKDAREWAIKEGLISGYGADKNGKPNYGWEDIPTREQLVTMLYGFHRTIKQETQEVIDKISDMYSENAK